MKPGRSLIAARWTIWLLLGALLVTWLAYNLLVMGWIGHRPAHPDALHPYPYQDHGVVYVTAADLLLSRTLLGLAGGLGAVAIIVSILGRRRYGSAFAPD